MPISDARDHLADVVNRAVYAGTVTHLTRRGRRLAVVVSEAHLAEEDARAREEATAAACRALWLGVRGADEGTQAAVRAVIGDLMDVAEDASDVAVAGAAMAERRGGALWRGRWRRAGGGGAICWWARRRPGPGRRRARRWRRGGPARGRCRGSR